MSIQGRCASCIHWDKEHWGPLPKSFADDYGGCTRITDIEKEPTVAVAQIASDDGGTLITRPTFGCTLWEEQKPRSGA